MQGYLVKLGNDQLGSGDVIVGPTIGFNDQSVIGTGSWTWTGVREDGNTYTGVNDNGTYYLGTDGNVYFVPDTFQVEEIISATATAAPTADFREFGTAGDDANIAAGAEDDVLYGGAGTGATNTGNDTIHAGAGSDTVFGGNSNDLIIGSGGADSIDGGSGADVIYGDNDTTVTSQAESLNWAAQGSAATDLTAGFTQDTGNMNVTVNFNADGAGSGQKEVSTNLQYTETGEPFDANSALFLQGDGGANTTVSMVFNAEEGTGMTDEVSNISFRLNDVDVNAVQWIDVITVNAYDIDGNPIAVTLTVEGDDTVNGQTVTAAGSGTDNPDLANGSVLVEIAGPVHSVEIIYANDVASGNQFLWVTDVHFDTVVEPDGADSISGGSGIDEIFGGGGDDALFGGAQSDTIYGGTGDDTVDGDGGNDRLFGGSGADQLIGDGGADTLVGGTGDDTLLGGNGNDRLFGGADNDSIDGGTGNDTAVGGDGNDSIAGGVGNDSLDGGDGDDTLSGGSDNDTITGASGDDTLSGGTGSDQFQISDNHDTDTITGGEDVGDGDIDTVTFSNTTSSDGVSVTYTGTEAGDYTYDGTTGSGDFVEIERLETTAFDDTIDGSASPTGITVDTSTGDDSIIGGAGADSINAGAGADTIQGGAGDDIIDLGGPDSNPDVLVFSDGDGADTIANFDAPIDNGDGTFTGIDTLDVSALNDLGGTPVNTNDVVVSGPTGGPAVLTFPGGETITLTGITPDQLGDPLALNAIGIPLPDDTEQPDGTVSGTGGDDLIDTSYLGDPDGDIVDNNDAIIPGDAANDDLIEAGGGSDSILAGVGDDTVYGDQVSTDGWVYEYYDLDPAPTYNTLADAGFSGADNSGTPTATGTTSTLTPSDYDTGDDYALKFTGVIDVETGGTYTFSTSSDDGSKLFVDGVEVVNNDGRHALVTQTGTITLGPGSHTIEIIYFENEGGNQLLADISGPDTGGAPSDLATYDNLLVDGVAGGDDTIAGEAGNDTLFGGEGDDTFVVGDGFDTDLITGGEDGETGGDTLDGSALTADVIVDYTDDEEGLLAAGFDLADFSEIEVVVTGSGTDTINSGIGDDTVFTNGGDDTFVVTGAFGDDSFTAGETGETSGDIVDATDLSSDTTVDFSGPEEGTLSDGTNTLTFSEVEGVQTGSGDDAITSGVGNDSVATNAGDDTFAITSGFGNDTFDAGETGETAGDTLDGSALTGDVSVNFSGPEAGTLSDGSDSVAFTDVENIFTGSGDDTVIGGTGDENVSTGAGNDTVSGGVGSDTFDTGAGDDTITIAEGDSVTSGDGDDTFTLEDLGETGNGPINIDGGDEVGGDTLQLGDLADLSTLVQTDDGTGSFSGSVTLDDGTLLTFTDIESIICFTPGTLIATPQGARDIASLRVGDMVVTRDHGLQPIRWIQSRTVRAEDNFAPIRIRPGVVTGLEEDILVSPQHRMLFQGYRAELLFGETEVLVAAKHLVDGQSVTQDSGGMVTYIHMMFDEHEIVYANGAASESFHPGTVGLGAVDAGARDELFALFPDLRSNPNGYGPTARRFLKKHETRLLHI